MLLTWLNTDTTNVIKRPTCMSYEITNSPCAAVGFSSEGQTLSVNGMVWYGMVW